MLYVRPGVKSNQVTTKHAEQQFAAPRENSEDLLRRPRDVPEKTDRQCGMFFAQEPRHQRQVKILNPDKVEARRLRFGRRGKHSIHPAIRLPMRRVEYALGHHEMHQWPQCTITYSVVVARYVSLAESRQQHRKPRGRGRHQDHAGPMLSSGPRDPKSAVSLEQTKKRGADSTHSWLDPFAPAFFDQSDRRAIRHHEHPRLYFIAPAGRLGNLR